MQEAQEMWVRFLDQEDALEEEMATHSGILAENLMHRGAWQATVHGVTKCQTWLSMCTHTHNLQNALKS